MPIINLDINKLNVIKRWIYGIVEKVFPFVQLYQITNHNEISHKFKLINNNINSCTIVIIIKPTNIKSKGFEFGNISTITIFITILINFTTINPWWKLLLLLYIYIIFLLLT